MSARGSDAGADHGYRLLTLVLVVFVPFTAAYYLSYVFRTVNAVIAPDLVADTGLTAADVGLLTSMYLFAFAVFQLPVGLLLDRFGPRRVDATMLLFAAVGAIVFSQAETLMGLALGRMLIGLGVSCCLMASFKAFVQWFDTRNLPLVNGCLLAFGAFGALSATVPVEWLLGYIDWRALFLGMGVLVGLIALVLAVVVPEHPAKPVDVSLRDQLAGLAAVYRDRFFWRIAPAGSLSLGVSIGVQGLWAGLWLRDVAGLDRAGVATHLMIGAFAMGIGFFTTGVLARALSRIGIPTQWVAAGGVALFMLVIAAMALGVQTGTWFVMASFGFLATFATLNFAVLSQHFPSHKVGRANTAYNMLVFTSAFLIQWLLGLVIGIWEDPVTQRYGMEGYRIGFGSLAALQFLALLWFLRPRKQA